MDHQHFDDHFPTIFTDKDGNINVMSQCYASEDYKVSLSLLNVRRAADSAASLADSIEAKIERTLPIRELHIYVNLR